jgi:hypothetical protein
MHFENTKISGYKLQRCIGYKYKKISGYKMQRFTVDTNLLKNTSRSFHKWDGV